MSRKSILGACVGALLLAFAAVAIASPSFKQKASIKYTTKKHKKPAGISATLKASDTGASPAGNVKAADKVTIKLKGARVDFKGAKLCTKSKALAATCPKSTKISKSGSALANIVGTNPTTGKVTVKQDIPNKVTAYAKNKGVYFVVKGTTLPVTVVLASSLSKSGKLVTNVKRDAPALPGGNKIVLTKFVVKLKKSSRKVKGKRHYFIKTPKCGKSKKFKITASFRYSDGSKKTVTSKPKCK